MRSARERRFIARKIWLSNHLRNLIPRFFSFSSRDSGDNVVSLQVGFKPMSLGFASEELFGSKQSFGISDSPRCSSAGSSKGGGSIGLKLGPINGFIRFARQEKATFLSVIVRSLKLTGDNLYITLYGPNQL